MNSPAQRLVRAGAQKANSYQFFPLVVLSELVWLRRQRWTQSVFPVQVPVIWRMASWKDGPRTWHIALGGALLGKEIGTGQVILPVVGHCFRRAPHIALGRCFLALRASECNGWPRRWASDNGAIGAQEEPAVFRRNTRALRVLREEPSLHGIRARKARCRWRPRCNPTA